MRRILIAPCLATCLLGCNSTHLLYVHDTSVGINVGAATEGTAKVSLGYDRETYAMVPKKADSADVMSLAASSCVYSSPWGSRIQFVHTLATGSVTTTQQKQQEFSSLEVKAGTKCD